MTRTLRSRRTDLPMKELMGHSTRLLLWLVLASAVIPALYERDLKLLLLRIILVGLMVAGTFVINTALLIHFHKRKKDPVEKTGRRVFLFGWFFTALLLLSFHLAIKHLSTRGYLSAIEHFNEDALISWGFLPKVLFGGLILNTVVFLIQSFVLHRLEKSRIEVELLRLKAVNTETTNRLLQQQIQPHFLFNALNVLKSLIRKQPDAAEAYLIRLSDFLRTSVSGSKTGVATLREELKLCADYMEMQQVRFGQALRYQVQIEPGDPRQGRQLPFFALQPLLENAIKHNELTDAYPLTITIALEEDEVVVRNNVQAKKTMELSSGNGLSNLQERYRLLSGDRVRIERDDAQFTVSLKLL